MSCCENNQACCLKETEVVFQGSISYGEEENEIIIHYITDEYELYNYGVEVKEGKYEVAISVLGDFGINNDNGFNSSGEIEFFLGGMHGFVTHTVMGKKID